MQIYASNGQVYKLKGSDEINGVPKIYILKKHQEETRTVIESEGDGIIHDNLDDFEEINEELLEKLEFYDQQLE